MAINRYISFLFMLITVLSAHPDGMDNLRNISDIDLYKSIIRSGLELSHGKQYFKNSENMADVQKLVYRGIQHQKSLALVKDCFSVNRELFEIYSIKLEDRNAISINRNDVWRHAVF